MLPLSLAVITLLMGMPVVFVLGVVSMTYLYSADMPLILLAQRLFVGMDSFVLLAIPFYVLMGDILSQGLVTDILIAWAKTIVGRIRGGLGAVTIIVEIIFSGISGSGSADASALGSVLIPAMEKEKYDKAFAAGVVASASILGPIIPPSIAMVLYSSLSGVSLGRLLLAGVLPGLVMGLLLMVDLSFLSESVLSTRSRFEWRRVAATARDAIKLMGSLAEKYGYGFVDGEGRIRQPLMRKKGPGADGAAEPASPEKAIALVSPLLRPGGSAGIIGIGFGRTNGTLIGPAFFQSRYRHAIPPSTAPIWMSLACAMRSS